MKKILLTALIILVAFTASAQAARADKMDIWFLTDDEGGYKHEYYFGLDTLKEDFANREFRVSAKLVVNGRLGNSRPHKFRLVNSVWYAKQTTSSMDFIPINSNKFYLKLFDALTPYSELARTYPR